MIAIDDAIEQKQALRDEMKARRSLMNENQRARAAWSLCDYVLDWLQRRQERVIGVYLARPYEISLDNAIQALLRDGYTVAAPRVDVERGEMGFWRLENLEDVEIGPWNVRQPLAREPIAIEALPLLIVPGLAFDPSGGRLGTGGGWYDRVLGGANVVAGVSFDCQIVPRVPLEDHDRRVHFVGSEERWLEVR